MSGSIRSMLALAGATSAAIMAIAAVGASADDGIVSGNTLAGTWRVTVNRPSPLPPLTSLQVFTKDGSVIEAANDSATRSASYGSWERVGGHLYASTYTFFRFDPQTGAWIGTMKVDRNLRLAADGESLTAIAVVTAFDVAGQPAFSFKVPSTGERIGVDRIPDLP
jgi:hypothetical protein